MVQTYQSPVRIYKFPFELVMAAYHKRFPTCPQIPIFVGSEITYEWKAEDGGEEIIERKCQLNVEAPYLVKKIAGVDYVYFKQRNHLDLRSRTLLIEASNISFSSRIVVIENCRYYVHAENPEWTCFEQSASLDVKNFFGLEAAIEKLAVRQYSANIAKGKEILEFFIDDLIKSGVTHVPKWMSNSDKENAPADNADLQIDMAIAKALTEKDSSGEKIFDRISPPCTPPASSSGLGSSTTTTNATLSNENDLNLPPLSGTAEEKLSMDELKRRRSAAGGAGANKQSSNATLITTDTSKKTSKPEVAGRTKSFDELESKLESEYIQRFLGELTPLEESRLCQLKYGLQSDHKGKIPNDAHLLRFLRARDFDVNMAKKMVVESLLWRKQHNVDKILHEFVPSPILLKYFPGGWHHNDIQGRPLFILCLGKMDIKGLLRSIGLEAIVRFTLSICEQGLLKTAEATNRLGKPISAWTLLVDLEGLSMRHLWRPGVQCLSRIIETLEAHYPECLGKVLITRAPRVFPILWTLVSPFIDVNTRKKFELYASNQVLQELARYIPQEFLPDFLGGPCPFENGTNKEESLVVPKSEYLSIPGEELFRENVDDILTSIYTRVTVSRNLPYEICVWVEQIGSVLTWDFDILKGDCEFIIYHSEKKIVPKTQHANQTITGTTASGPGPLDRVVDTVTNELSSILSPPVQHFQAIITEPEFCVGNELTIVQRSLNFGEGDAMQGSHFCAKPGTYVLQWRYPNLGADSSNIPNAKKDSLPDGEITTSAAAQQSQQTKTSTALAHSKCRLMVYHQLLDSVDFRGSVASLASCRSSFNSLAAAEALHSSNPNSPSAKRRVRTQQQQQQTQQLQQQQQTEDEEDSIVTERTLRAEEVS